MLAPLWAFLFQQGTETLPLRMDYHIENAARVASYLKHRGICGEHARAVQAAERLHRLDALPLTPAGKVLKSALAARLAQAS